MTTDFEAPRPGVRGRPRSATRSALLDAARELIRSGEPLTTVTLTRRVGVTQPAFYAHFRSVEECEREVFREVAERLRRMHSEHRRTLLSGRPFDLEANTEHLEKILHDLIDNAVWFQIAMRRRHDTSAMGDVVRTADAGAREELAADLRDVMKLLGVKKDREKATLLQAELALGSVSVAVEAILAGRQTDVRFVARTLAHVFVGSMKALATASDAE